MAGEAPAMASGTGSQMHTWNRGGFQTEGVPSKRASDAPGRAFSSPLLVRSCILQMTIGQHRLGICSNNNLLSG